ncbi:TEX9 family protein [Megaselia abdita]
MPDLIAREKEFMKLNEELNRKTHVPTGFHGGDSKLSHHGTNKFSTYTKKGPTSVERFRGGGGGIFGKSQIKTLPTTPESSDTDKKKSVDIGGTYKITKKRESNPPALPPKMKKESMIKGSTTIQNQRFPWTFRNILKKDSNMIREEYRNENFTESPSLDEILGKQKIVESPKDTISKEVFNSTSRSVKPPPASPDKIAKKNLSNDGLIKFLKSKVAILQEELESSSHESAKKSEELHKTYEKLKKLEAQRDQAISKNNSLSEQLSKIEHKFDSLEKQLKEKEVDMTTNNKELETMKRELKVTKQANTNLEKRLYRTNEELENMKNTLSAYKDSERELKDSTRLEKDSQEKQIKSLKKQRSDLLEAYKKQLYLIDNLRRQNICLEQAKLLKFGEKELSKVLDWNNKN